VLFYFLDSFLSPTEPGSDFWLVVFARVLHVQCNFQSSKGSHMDDGLIHDSLAFSNLSMNDLEVSRFIHHIKARPFSPARQARLL